MSKAAASAVLLFALLTSACNPFARKPKAQAPPPTPPPVTPAATPAPKPKVIEPPQIPTQQTPTVPEAKPPLPEAVKPQPQPPPAPKPAARAPRRRTTTTPPKPVVPETQAPQPAAPPSAPAEAPRLGELMDADQRRQVQQTFDANQVSTRQALAEAGKHVLSREQSDAAVRVRSLLEQADELQKTDLRTASQLALRANQLVRDLLATLK